MDDIGSPAMKIYFNFSNALQNGRDLYSERKNPSDRLSFLRLCASAFVYRPANSFFFGPFYQSNSDRIQVVDISDL